jgi:dynein intermediate chain 2
MLEREAKREKTLESAARDKRLKATQKRPNSGAIKPSGTALEDLLKMSEEDFYKTIEDEER